MKKAQKLLKLSFNNLYRHLKIYFPNSFQIFLKRFLNNHKNNLQTHKMNTISAISFYGFLVFKFQDFGTAVCSKIMKNDSIFLSTKSPKNGFNSKKKFLKKSAFFDINIPQGENPPTENIDDEGVPLSDNPFQQIIDDVLVPLGLLPKTSDGSISYTPLLALMGASGLLIFALIRRRIKKAY